MKAELSQHYRNRSPSAIRRAQILFAQRPDKDRITVVNLAIGNVSLPMHPAMQARMRNLGAPESPFADGVVKYTASVGTDEAQAAFLNIIASCGVDSEPLRCVVTDGGSAAMELMVLGVCGPKSDRPLLMLDPAYTNYMDMAKRAGVPTVSARRELDAQGAFSEPNLAMLESVIREHRPRGIVVIPADNPTGQFLAQPALEAVARICVEHGMWLISDEAYRQLNYDGQPASSIWKLTEAQVPGIQGRRISIESASKVWNACGLRIGALVTDNHELHARAVAEYTANLSSNAIGQYIFGSLAHVAHPDLEAWYASQRAYYTEMMSSVATGLRDRLPGIIVSRPDAALYSVVDVRGIAPESFDAGEFVRFCAEKGEIELDGAPHTLLVAPMNGFYGTRSEKDPSRFQMRIAFVEPPDAMKKVPELFARLFEAYGG